MSPLAQILKPFCKPSISTAITRLATQSRGTNSMKTGSEQIFILASWKPRLEYYCEQN